MNSVAQDFVLEPNDKDRIAYLVGPEDENLKQLDKRLGVKISYSGAHFHVEGSHAAVKKAVKLVKSLYIDTTPTKNSKKPSEVTPDMVHLAITEVAHLEDDDNDYQNAEDRGSVGAIYHKANNFKTKRGFVKARTSNQSDYISKISSHDVSFGIGPAGTGKTYLAVAAAVDALERNEIRRIILTRPAVEAGEKLGFLPGDLSQKLNPYLKPLYDSMEYLLTPAQIKKLEENGSIEISPLAYMRGRSINKAVIILDEAQNTTKNQMKMFLTRLGESSQAIITGDITQIDLPKKSESGLVHALSILHDIESLSITEFSKNDIIRSRIVKEIISCYDNE